ncbi:hypothetical protein [Arcobacter sp. FWKO B]|uniref:hypothetical protein n=1 Tax=Arcobacter sp. FWKO B TaxID=2593672 RepID=UPI0018A67C54|nr:hypothetical protein [Arcobacter sp. FWKO B]QOG12848.1 hypothetical protein FWKOB_09150 [Arcobacter sp. FWKO B]
MLNNKFGWYLISCIFLFEGVASFLGYKVYFKYSGGWKNVGYDYSLYITIAGLIIGYYAYNLKEKPQKHTKCPTCKETFNYNELENGKCPYCKDVDTVDIEEYYKQYPKERDDK